MKNDKPAIDLPALVATIVLVGIGLVMIYSASFAVAGEKFGSSNFFVVRHLFRLGLGFCAMYVAMHVDYHNWAKIDRALLGLSLILLVMLLVHSGVQPINGAKRWLRIWSFSFQPSELSKFVLVLFLARSLSEKEEKLSDFTEGLLPHLALIGVVVTLIALEPNFSTAMAIGMIAVSMTFAAGAKARHLLGVGASLLPVVYMLLLKAPYRRARLMAFFDPNSHVKDVGYQAHQALIGLGAGGLLGSGLGKSRQKFFYLPEPYTDFVFSVLGEELGFVGALAVLGIFGLLAWRGLRIALRAPDAYGRVLGFGITATLTIYVLFHVGVSTSILPTTGIPMPFISYGGMSLVFTLMAVGVLLNISTQADPKAMRSKPKRSTFFQYGRH